MSLFKFRNFNVHFIGLNFVWMVSQGKALIYALASDIVFNIPFDRIKTGFPFTGVKDLPTESLNSVATLFNNVIPSREN